MRELALTLAIVVASFGQAQAQTMPAEVPSTYPEDGMFCGFMKLCAPKAAVPRPDATPIEDKVAQPVSQ
ncbi:hypothetical protein [uncultured Tateyamaria sp.]|uniref:hypothetical protein n=1 Tax=uncultured Tateyamaria sp. TaxID=455651 RepID=UPI00260AD70C|nr:hypothetical protein [uncultured Tateyamaria sp.]